MPKVQFDYDIHKDAWSWVLIAKSKHIWGLDQNKEVSFIPAKLLVKIRWASFADAVKMTEEHIKSRPERAYMELIIKSEMSALEKSWRVVEKKYFEALANITGKPIFSEQFGCFWTTGYMCPYDEKEKWFMVSFWHSVPFSITTICHEIMHLQFLRHYKSYLKKKGLTSEQIDTLKESLTFMLNEPEFSEVVLSYDEGYPKHQELRKKLEAIWRKENNFQKLLEEAIPLVKFTK